MICPAKLTECPDRECEKKKECVIVTPVEYSPEYQELVNDVLEEARRKHRLPRIKATEIV